MVRVGVLAVLVAVGTILVSSSASGTPTPNTFIAVVSPSTGAIAGKATAYTFTITNSSASQQSLGSANVTAPFPISSLDSIGGGGVPCPVPLPGGGPPCATLATSTSIQLRNLNLAPGASILVGFTATTPCIAAADPYTWNVEARPTNGFNGTDFQLDTASTLTTTLFGACTLAFTHQPAAAVVNTTITRLPYNTSAGPVTVAVLDGSGTTKVTTGSFTITVGLAASCEPNASLLACGTGSLASASSTLTKTADTSNSFDVSFGDLSINDNGGYRLAASDSTLQASSATSGYFPITDQGKTCSSEHCALTASSSTTGSTLDVGSGSGILSLSLVKNAPVTCGNYTQVHGQASVADISPASSGGFGTTGGTVTLTTSHSAAPGTGVGGFTICLASTVQFTTADGTQSPLVGGFYVGTLPSCSAKHPVAPCIVSKNRSVTSADLIITFLIAPGDPMWYD